MGYEVWFLWYHEIGTSLSKRIESVEHFKQELAKYIEYYNYKRIKAKLKGMSSVQYRALMPNRLPNDITCLTLGGSSRREN